MTTLRIDPHVHSEESYDGKEPVEIILEHAADIGLDGVVITDHDEIDASLRAAETASEYGLVGVPGVEVSTSHGHLLALGVEEKPPKRQPFADTVERVRELGGVAVVPHPFQVTRHGVKKKRIVDCDGIEVYNAWLFTGYRNRRARAFAYRHGYPRLGGSDAHSITTLGRAYTEIEVDRERDNVTADDVVTAVKNGDTAIHGRRAPLTRSAYHYLKASARKLSWAARTVTTRFL
ncbi:MAG: CehA/McbA family metallohydrolase [Halobacteriales archaeon]